MNYFFALAFGIGGVAGLRAFTPAAAVAWAAHLGWLNLNNSSLAFMGSIITVVIFSLLALFELFVDLSLQRRNELRLSRSGPAFSWAVFAVPAFARQAINSGSPARFWALSAD
jgi:uncharacterized membrane protein